MIDTRSPQLAHPIHGIENKIKKRRKELPHKQQDKAATMRPGASGAVKEGATRRGAQVGPIRPVDFLNQVVSAAGPGVGCAMGQCPVDRAPVCKNQESPVTLNDRIFRVPECVRKRERRAGMQYAGHPIRTTATATPTRSRLCISAVRTGSAAGRWTSQ